MLDFREALEICEVVNLGFVGVPYTYDNKRSDVANVKVCLDICTTTSDSRNIFGSPVVKHLIASCSGHFPLMIDGLPKT